MIKKGGMEFETFFPPNGKQGPAALTNEKQENFDQIHVGSGAGFA